MTTATREKLLQAATRRMLEQGYNGTTVDQICTDVGTTKGAFFHHFQSKGAIGHATIDRYADRIFGAIDRSVKATDPIERVFEYVDALGDIAHRQDRKPACLLAIETMELGAVDEAFRVRCAGHFERWVENLEGLIGAALAAAGNTTAARPLAEHLIALFEGSLILARARGDATIIQTNVAQFRRHLATLVAS